MHLEHEIEPGQAAGCQPALEGAAVLGPRDRRGRALDQAQQEDQRWREAEIRKTEETALRVRLLEGRVGLSAAAIGIGLIALGMGCTRSYSSSPNQMQWLATITGLFLGAAAVCLSAAFLLVLGKKYRASLRRHLRHFGLVTGERTSTKRTLSIRKQRSPFR